VFVAPGAPVWLWFLLLLGLFLFLFPQLLVSGFPAVGDLGQELAEVLNLSLCPHVDDAPADGNNFGGRHLALSHVVGQGLVADFQPLGRFAC
jgi:hypothetical protein